ncbi:hypothetical protein D3C74_494000 [compost metagenome]
MVLLVAANSSVSFGKLMEAPPMPILTPSMATVTALARSCGSWLMTDDMVQNGTSERV